MGDNNQLSLPEEDEDLEALRLAALQSLKKKSTSDTQTASFITAKEKVNAFNGSPRGKQKRNKFTRTPQGRTPRNGQFNGWCRNSNLITVPMVNDNADSCNSKNEDEIPKLVLPQDRYHKKEKTPEKSDATSKFDRYDNSDESDSESEEEKPELKRSNSLEALMAELENEIQGVATKPEEKAKNKLKKKRKPSVTEEKPEPKPVISLKENLKPENEPVKKFQNFKQRKWQKARRQPNYIPPNVVHQVVPPEIIQPIVAFPPPQVQAFPVYNPMGFENVYAPPPLVFEPPPQLPPLHVAPPLYERPLSPLTINTEAFSTTTLAPLSPRSAAFVLENRAIIEKRKRRSFSRSPSPRFRRSPKSPKRSLSPKRFSKSPKRRSLSPSPIRKVIPPRLSSPKKAPIHDRLGVKSKTEEKTEDPVLEARRKKFEKNEITIKEGVIKLKKPEEEEEKKSEEIDEDALLEGDTEADDTILLDHKVDALFSDEESDSDNEGRFKTKQETNQKVAILPFSKLINGSKSSIKNYLKLDADDRKDKKRYRSKSPKTSSKKINKTTVKKDKLIVNERKIEIKIRNPAKYEKTETKIEDEKKVEVEKKDEIENEEVATSNITEGDLRAQLSRKRAERQKHPLPDVVPSRLLQSALQGVGFQKGKKTKIADDSDGKLPIHLRLGASNLEIRKKSRKTNKGSQEQV